MVEVRLSVWFNLGLDTDYFAGCFAVCFSAI